MNNNPPTPAAEPTTGILRARLAEAAPELHSALERSRKIALDDWLSAVPPAMDSFNSYPHLRNVENHLDQVVTNFEMLPPSPARLDLRPVEIYVLLASVLFHDLGRAMHGKPHPILSESKIVGEYGVLGIPSLELAKCIAAISLGHAPPKTWLPSNLYDVVIDPYGEVRQRILRALLVLGDHMDGSHNRARPQYIDNSSGPETIGLFRRVVRGVYADCECHMVRVVLADMKPWKETKLTTREEAQKSERPVNWDSYYYFPDPIKEKDALRELGLDQHLLDQIRLHNLDDAIQEAQQKKAQVSKKECRTRTIDAARTIARQTTWVLHFLRKTPPPISARRCIKDWLKRLLPPDKQAPPPLAIWHFLEAQERDPALSTAAPKWLPPKEKRLLGKMSSLDWLVAFGFLHVRLQPRTSRTNLNHESVWPHPALLAVIMRDVGANHQALETIRSDLAGARIPLRAWLLEHKEHLYTRFGRETYEPAFHEDLLDRVARAMWELSLSVFGCARFSYDELASQAREPNVGLVRRAVRRLAIIERCELYQDSNPASNRKGSSISPGKSAEAEDRVDETDAIWAGETQWRWAIRDRTAFRCSYCPHAWRCWRKGLRTKAQEKPDRGLWYIQELIHHLQSPLS